MTIGSMHDAALVLQDGTVFAGRAFGAAGEASGEVVFNTGMTGYQEICTDPSYFGQIVAMTYPHIGNVGVNPEDVESMRPHVSGLVVRDYCASPSNWRSTLSLHEYLEMHGVVALTGIDTRALTLHIRRAGAMPGILSAEGAGITTLRERAAALPSMIGQPLAHQVTCRAPYEWTEGLAHGVHSPPETRPHIVVYDFGVKQNILRLLVDTPARVTVVPADTSAAVALAYRPDGILLSNGPGDPAALTGVIAEIRQLIGRVPLFGICLGHQVMGLALGGGTFKLKFGHRGANQPVQDLRTGRVAVTSQNHGFAVQPDSLPPAVEVTHRNLNDRTIEGFVSRQHRLMACQYHPEASPGPHDAMGLFTDFLRWCAGDDAETH